MFARLNSKIVLIVVGVISVIIIVIVFAVIQGRRTQEEATSQDEPIQTDEPLTYEQLPQPSGGGGAVGAVLSPSPTGSGVILRPLPSPSPAPAISIGDLDWTKKPAEKMLEIPTSILNDPRLKSNDPCIIAGISDSWENPFEKTMCGMYRFFSKQLLLPLNALMCQMEASSLAVNYDKNIVAKLVNSACLVEDRR